MQTFGKMIQVIKYYCLVCCFSTTWQVLIRTMFPHNEKKNTITSWEIASSYRILYLLVLILAHRKIAFPFKYNCL